jgi:hypothetical protein
MGAKVVGSSCSAPLMALRASAPTAHQGASDRLDRSPLLVNRLDVETDHMSAYSCHWAATVAYHSGP